MHYNFLVCQRHCVSRIQVSLTNVLFLLFYFGGSEKSVSTTLSFVHYWKRDGRKLRDFPSVFEYLCELFNVLNLAKYVESDVCKIRFNFYNNINLNVLGITQIYRLWCACA